MSIATNVGNAFDVAKIIEIAMNGKQPIAPLLADIEETLVHIQAAATSALRVVRAASAINEEIQTKKE